MLAAWALGLVLGSATSVFICGESAYGGSPWSQLARSLVLSPVLMTIGTLVSLGEMGLGFFLLLLLGAFSSISALFIGISRRFPKPQWLMFAGTFLWSLGNATSMETMMGI